MAASQVARKIGVGERGRVRHDACDQRLEAAVEEIVLHGIAERHLGGQTAELGLEFRKAVHEGRCVDRTGYGRAEERGPGGGDAGDGMHARRDFFDVDPGSQVLRHGRPPATVSCPIPDAA
jgi:hypothetical protein